MVKVRSTGPTGPVQQPREPSKKSPDLLKSVRDGVQEYVLRRGRTLLGAGRPALINKKYPKEEAKKVAEAVKDFFNTRLRP